MLINKSLVSISYLKKQALQSYPKGASKEYLIGYQSFIKDYFDQIRSMIQYLEKDGVANIDLAIIFESTVQHLELVYGPKDDAFWEGVMLASQKSNAILMLAFEYQTGNEAA